MDSLTSHLLELGGIEPLSPSFIKLVVKFTIITFKQSESLFP